MNNKMSQINSSKITSFSSKKASPKNLEKPKNQSPPKTLKLTPKNNLPQGKKPIKQTPEKPRISRTPPKINDPFVGQKKLKTEVKQEVKEKTLTPEQEKQEDLRKEQLLELLIGDIESSFTPLVPLYEGLFDKY